MDQKKKTMTGKEFWEAVTSDPAQYKPQTEFKVSIPAGKDFKLLNLLDIKSSGDVDVTFKLPFAVSNSGLNRLFNRLKEMGVSMGMKEEEVKVKEGKVENGGENVKKKEEDKVEGKGGMKD